MVEYNSAVISEYAMTDNGQSVRRGRGKTKTGCLTCKFRRVKCDEIKPYCLRCTKFGRKCDGYEPLQARSKKAENRKGNGVLTIKPRPLLNIYEPSVTIPGNAEERRYFQLFSQETAGELCGYFDSSFWAQIVPQASLTEPCIRHAVTAIASLSKMADEPPDRSRPTALNKIRDEHYKFGIEQYNKAIMSLRLALSGQENALRIALIACILFVCLESIQGDQVAASAQVHGGLNLMHQVQRTRLKMDKKGKQSNIEDEIVQMYSNINVQSFFLVFSHNPHHPEIVPHHMQESHRHIFSSSIPHIFTSVAEAKHALDLIMNSVVQFFSSCHSDHEDEVQKYTHHHARLQQWESAFEPLLIRAKAITSIIPNGPSDNANLKAKLSPIILSTYHRAALIALTGAVRHDESVYDYLRKDFLYIVSSCRSVLDAILPPYSTSSPRTSRHQSRFSFEVGLMPPLYVAATKCREPKLRRQAIELLRECPAQEGLWEPWGASRISEWMMEIEEAGWVGGKEMEVIPESSRVRLTGMQCELGRRRIWVQCKGVMPETEEGLVKVWETVIRW